MEFLHSKKLTSGGNGASTQKYIDVESIEDGVIILKNGSFRAVLLVSSINFDLKSTEEQDIIIEQYQGFLNSHDFPIEVLVSSRRLNIEPYLDFLTDKEKTQTNELLKLQISEYKNFIKNLTEISNIMSKYFYIVVPFYPVESNKGGVFNKVSSMFNPKQVITQKHGLFETYKNQLWQRVDHIIAGLSGTGVRIVPLKTEEIIELLYNSYNPNIYTNSIIKNVEDIELNK
jgi:hypothetical protein